MQAYGHIVSYLNCAGTTYMMIGLMPHGGRALSEQACPQLPCIEVAQADDRMAQPWGPTYVMIGRMKRLGTTSN